MARVSGGEGRAATFVQAALVSGGRRSPGDLAVFPATLSFRDVEELLAQRGIDASCKTIRCWTIKFGPPQPSPVLRFCRIGNSGVGDGGAVSPTTTRLWKTQIGGGRGSSAGGGHDCLRPGGKGEFWPPVVNLSALKSLRALCSWKPKMCRTACGTFIVQKAGRDRFRYPAASGSGRSAIR